MWFSHGSPFCGVAMVTVNGIISCQKMKPHSTFCKTLLVIFKNYSKIYIFFIYEIDHFNHLKGIVQWC